MDILDVHIVRIKDLTEETDFSLDVEFAVDNPAYSSVPKKVKWRDMIAWIVYVVFSQKIYTEREATLRDGIPLDITFPYEFTTDYIIVPSFLHSDEQAGLTITNETSTGFTVTSIGADVTLDFTVIPITPIGS